MTPSQRKRTTIILAFTTNSDLSSYFGWRKLIRTDIRIAVALAYRSQHLSELSWVDSLAAWTDNVVRSNKNGLKGPASKIVSNLGYVGFQSPHVFP